MEKDTVIFHNFYRLTTYTIYETLYRTDNVCFSTLASKKSKLDPFVSCSSTGKPDCIRFDVCDVLDEWEEVCDEEFSDKSSLQQAAVHTLCSLKFSANITLATVTPWKLVTLLTNP